MNGFESPAWNLDFAANDARLVAESVTASLRNRYDEIVTISLISEGGDSTATKRNLETILLTLPGAEVASDRLAAVPNGSALKPARPEDFLLVSFSTHG